MKQKLLVLAGGLIALGLPLRTLAQNQLTPSPMNAAQAQELPNPMQQSDAPISTQANFGPKAHWDTITEVKITNLDGKPLGRIEDLVLDLSNGRIVEVLVVSDQFLRFGGKTVAVPPGALIPDATNKAYMINISAEAFKDAPKFDLATWSASTQPDQVAAAYQYFRQDTSFLAANEAPGRTSDSGRPLTSLGIVERMSKLINMQVENLQGKRLGKLQTLVLDVPAGRILNAYISNDDAGMELKYSTVIPPTLLSFKPKHDGLLLDVSKVVYNEEPHVIFQDGSDGQVISSEEQAATGPHTHVALVQGTSYRDINTTSRIYQSIQGGNLESWNVEVATLAGRVTLRGTVDNQGTKDSIGACAIAEVKLDNVDNQITVMPPPVVITPAQAAL